MSSEIFESVWRFGRTLQVFDPNSSQTRSFRGFLEPMSLRDAQRGVRRKSTFLPRERFRLIAEPSEDFFGATARKLICGDEEFEILAIKHLHFGEAKSHRECVLLKVGEVTADA